MQENERDELLRERQTLVTGRLFQIRSENELQQDYWKAVCDLLLDGPKEAHFLDNAAVRPLFGEFTAVFSFLYAVCFQAAAEKTLMREELHCAVMELAVEMYLMKAENSSLKALHDTLYYFAADYAEETALYHRALLEADCAKSGGPFLLSSADTALAPGWIQHAGDYGLYMGSRYAERYSQAVITHHARDARLSQLLEEAALFIDGQAASAQHQRDVLAKLSVSVGHPIEGAI